MNFHRYSIFGSAFILILLSLYALHISPKFQRNIFGTEGAVAFSSISNYFQGFESCNLEEISFVPKNSIAIIGHAYGKAGNKGIAKKISLFIEVNKNSLGGIIFNGDVFEVPNLTKWNALKELVDPIPTYISPGNHDLNRESSSLSFLDSDLYLFEYPKSLKLHSNDFILDDSNSSFWNLSTELESLIDNKMDENLIVIRHNAPIKELLPLVNSYEGLNNSLDNIKTLSKKFNENKKITWIIGDGGGKRLPRLNCYIKDNHRFIVSGIGDVVGDTILLLYQNKVLALPL